MTIKSAIITVCMNYYAPIIRLDFHFVFSNLLNTAFLQKEFFAPTLLSNIKIFSTFPKTNRYF